MGQRLVITIENNEKNLAKGYYHWSGYTSSGLTVTNAAVKAFEKSFRRAAETMALQAITDKTITPEKMKYKINTLTACNMLFETNAGMEMSGEKSEQDAFNEMFPGVNHTIGMNRNDGLVAITEKGMADLQKWSEADVTINIDTKSVSVAGLFMGMYDEDDDDEENNNKEIIEIGGDLDSILFDDLDQFVEKVVTAIRNRIYTFSNNGDTLTAIE